MMKMKYLISTLHTYMSKKGGLLLGLIVSISISVGQPRTKVACIGNSVTFGYGLASPSQDSYPSQLQALLGQRFEVRNFGHSGATLLRKGHRPYDKTEEYRNALAFKPDIAIIHLGLNDTDPRNWPNYKNSFAADYATLIDSIRSVNPKVKIYICRLTPIFSGHARFLSGTRDWYDQIQQLIPRIQKNIRGRIYTSAIGLGLTIPALLFLGLGQTLPAVVGAAVCFGIGFGIFDANNMPILCQVVPKNLRATAYGFMNMVGVFAGAVITQWLGKFKDEGHFGLGFALLGGAVLLALLLQLLFLKPKTTEK